MILDTRRYSFLLIAIGLSACGAEDDVPRCTSSALGLSCNAAAERVAREHLHVPVQATGVGAEDEQETRATPTVLAEDDVPRCAETAQGMVCNAAGQRVRDEHAHDTVQAISADGERIETDKVPEQPHFNAEDDVPRCALTAQGMVCNAAGEHVRDEHHHAPVQAVEPDNGSEEIGIVQHQPSEARLHEVGGTFVVPVLINNSLKLDFFVDSGAASVSIPADVVLTLIRTGTVRREDFLGNRAYTTADGNTLPSVAFNIRLLNVAGHEIRNVEGSVAPVQGSLLLGQSFLRRFRSWSIDNNRHVLLLDQ